MKKSIPIDSKWFDEIRRGVKTIECRPITAKNRAIFLDPYLSHLIFHQYRVDKLECRVVSATIGEVPAIYKEAWAKKYPGQDQCINIELSHPRYYRDFSGKSTVVLHEA